jgi:hypothetical protein
MSPAARPCCQLRPRLGELTASAAGLLGATLLTRAMGASGQSSGMSLRVPLATGAVAAAGGEGRVWGGAWGGAEGSTSNADSRAGARRRITSSRSL